MIESNQRKLEFLTVEEIIELEILKGRDNLLPIGYKIRIPISCGFLFLFIIFSNSVPNSSSSSSSKPSKSPLLYCC
jgi:hypothetical protein